MGNEMDVYRALNHRLEAARARRLLRDNARKQAVAERRACSAVRPAKPAPARDEAATEESRADGLTS